MKPREVHAFLEAIVGQDFHAKRVLSLADGVVGVLHAATLGIHAIGRGGWLLRAIWNPSTRVFSIVGTPRQLSSGGNNAYELPANEWHCIELHFAGTARVQTLYVEGEEILVAQDYPASAIAFTVFKFGYLGYHNEADRGLWYDEVAVAPSRIGCE